MALLAALLLALLPQQESAVGMPARIHELVLPGSELQVAPLDVKSPLMLRILAVRPHGSDFRYDLEYWGLDPGVWNLAEHLVRKDGSSTADLPPVAVSVRSVLPEGQVTPRAPAIRRPQVRAGYTKLLIAAGAFWILGLVAIVRGGRKRRAEERALERPLSLAERLRPLVQRALEGSLSSTECSQLELSLVGYWRRRLGLEDRPPLEVLAELRAHPEAGPLLVGLEHWLHDPASRQRVDVNALLAPYRDLPPEVLDAPRETAAALR